MMHSTLSNCISFVKANKLHGLYAWSDSLTDSIKSASLNQTYCPLTEIILYFVLYVQVTILSAVSYASAYDSDHCCNQLI